MMQPLWIRQLSSALKGAGRSSGVITAPSDHPWWPGALAVWCEVDGQSEKKAMAELIVALAKEAGDLELQQTAEVFLSRHSQRPDGDPASDRALTLGLLARSNAARAAGHTYRGRICSPV